MADIKKILASMTVDEKIGQLMLHNANLFIDTAADITGPMTQMGLSKEMVNNIGSVLNFKTGAEAREIQKKHLENDRNGIPMVFMMDVIHGYRTIFPIPLAMGCSFDNKLFEECCRMSAVEAVKGGVKLTYTPMVDYVRDARWGRVMETCGEDPMLNSVMGAAQIKGFQGDDLSDETSVATCVKHYAAYGGGEAGKDYNTVELSEHVLREYYLPAYKACIDAGTTMVMPSFNTVSGVPSTVNEWLMRKILREEWGFDGVVVSDYNALGELKRHGIAETEKQAAKLGFENGCDIEMVSNTYCHHLKELIEEGVFTEEQLDTAVLRVLELKNKLGLFEDPYKGICDSYEKEIFLTDEHREIARRAAEESAVLLKNNGILPLSSDVKKIALIGPFADENKIIGFWSCNGINDESTTINQGICAIAPDAEISVVKGCSNLWNDTDRSGFDEAIAAAKDADVVILCLGEPQNYSGEGNSRADIILPGLQQELAGLVCEANPNTVCVTFSGRPLALTAIEDKVAAILHMWFPGTEGGNAVANLLFGKANPCGKLSMSFPRQVGQCPLYYNRLNTGRPKGPDENRFYSYSSNYIDCPNSPLYPFGYGLSYSNFVYSEMALDRNEMTADGSITVSVKVKNDSEVDGKEVVQIYMRDLFASNSRPVQQLIAFEKIHLCAGEEKTVTFTVNESMLCFWNNNNEYVSEPGEFTLSVGYADNMLFTEKFTLI